MRQGSGQSPGMDLEVAVEPSGISEQLHALGKSFDTLSFSLKPSSMDLAGRRGSTQGSTRASAIQFPSD